MAADRDRRELRLRVAEGAVLSLAEAARMLPWADNEARAWLKARGLVSHPCGRDVVVWRRVLAELERADSEAEGRTAPLRLPRVAL